MMEGEVAHQFFQRCDTCKVAGESETGLTRHSKLTVRIEDLHREPEWIGIANR